MSQVPDEYYPKKVFRFPCLAFFINEIYNANIHEYLQILKAILYCKAKLDQNRFLALARSKKKRKWYSSMCTTFRTIFSG